MTNWPQIVIDTDSDYNLCFGCGRDNPIGLKLKFQWDGKVARAEFTPTKFYRGWPGIVHGGVIACIFDEAIGCAALFVGVSCVTAEIRVKLRRPALIDQPFIITSSVIKKTRKLVKVKAKIVLKDGTPVAEGTGTQFVIGTKIE